nr:MAG TPA: hypothetical protein [Caudoviricetes sp.]
MLNLFHNFPRIGNQFSIRWLPSLYRMATI